MSFAIYDYHRDEDIRNVLITPQIRSRFLRMEPGSVADIHSHDLGHEIFLILEGRVIFEIGDGVEKLGPGQMCVALADEVHRVRVIGDEPMIMYLSVTPHIHPTHTPRTEDGERLPHRFAPPNAYDLEEDPNKPIEELIDHHVAVAESLAEAAQACARAQKEMGTKLKELHANGDNPAAVAARKEMWEGVYTMFKKVYEFGEVWNELAPRAAENEPE